MAHSFTQENCRCYCLWPISERSTFYLLSSEMYFLQLSTFQDFCLDLLFNTVYLIKRWKMRTPVNANFLEMLFHRACGHQSLGEMAASVNYANRQHRYHLYVYISYSAKQVCDGDSFVLVPVAPPPSERQGDDSCS